MDQNIRTSIQTSTFFYFLIIVVLTTVSQLVTMIAIVFGDISGKELVVAATVVASGFFGAFGIIRIMTNLHLIMHEMDDKTAATNWGREMQAIPLKVLRFVFSGIFLIVAIIQVITIYS
jgi:hypothetical protein